MARPKSVEGVRDAIKRTFSEHHDREPTNEEIIAAAGVSSATYYRVLDQHEDVKALLESARTGYRLVTRGDDPIAQRPHAAVSELREVVAALVHTNEELRREIERKDRELRRLNRQLEDGTVTPLRTHRRTGGD